MKDGGGSCSTTFEVFLQPKGAFHQLAGEILQHLMSKVDPYALVVLYFFIEIRIFLFVISGCIVLGAWLVYNFLNLNFSLYFKKAKGSLFPPFKLFMEWRKAIIISTVCFCYIMSNGVFSLSSNLYIPANIPLLGYDAVFPQSQVALIQLIQAVGKGTLKFWLMLSAL